MRVELAFIAMGLIGAITVVGFRMRVSDALRSRRSGAVDARKHAQLNSAATVQAVCDAIASALRANAIVVECARGHAQVIAGSPWRTTLQPLDIIAATWSFQSGQPSGAGTEHSALSDWLFVPVEIHGQIAAVFAVAGRYCRRTFDPRDPLIMEGVASLQGIIEGAVQQQRQFALT